MPAPRPALMRLRRTAGLAAAGAAALALAGPAQAACTQPSTAKAFAAFGDQNDYFAAPDGGFEGYASGWLKSNTAIVSENEPWQVAGGSKALRLNGSGASATSPGFCIDPSNPTIRLFTKSTATGGVDSSWLMIEAVVTSQIGTTSTILTSVSSHYGWAATPITSLVGATNAHLHSGLASNGTRDAEAALHRHGQRPELHDRRRRGRALPRRLSQRAREPQRLRTGVPRPLLPRRRRPAQQRRSTHRSSWPTSCWTSPSSHIAKSRVRRGSAPSNPRRS